MCRNKFIFYVDGVNFITCRVSIFGHWDFQPVQCHSRVWTQLFLLRFKEWDCSGPTSVLCVPNFSPRGSFGLTSCKTEMFLQVELVLWGCSSISHVWDPLQHPCFCLAAFSGGVAWLFSLFQQRGAVSPAVPSLLLLPDHFLRVWALQGGLSPEAKALSPSPVPTGGHCHTVLLTEERQSTGMGEALSPDLSFFALYDVAEKQLSCCLNSSTCKTKLLLSSSSKPLCVEVFGITTDFLLCKTFTISLLPDFFFFNVPVFGKHRWSREQDQIENKVNISPFHCISAGLVWLSPRLHKCSLCAAADRI